MKIDKKKLVFGGMLLLIVSFIALYSVIVLGEKDGEEELQKTTVPSLKEEQPQYDSRLEAVDNLKEKNPSLAPSIYDEDLIDKEGNFDPYLEENQKQRLMDSILEMGPDQEDYGVNRISREFSKKEEDSLSEKSPTPTKTNMVAIGTGHKEFFFGIDEQAFAVKEPSAIIKAAVNGDQVVRKDERLELRLLEDAVIMKDTLQQGTLLYANCSFKPNRLLLRIHSTGELGWDLEAYDVSDGQEGIYIENSFRSRATTEILDDVIQDINISGVPQVSGLKSIFQRSNRSVKVKVLNQYQLYLKPAL